MIWPPSVARLRIYENGRRKMNLWRPVVPIAPPLAPVVTPVPWLAAGRGRRRRAVMAGPVLFRLFCALEGVYFEAGNFGNGVRIAIC